MYKRQILFAAVQLFLAIAQAVPQILEALIPAIGALIQAGIDHLPTFLENMGNAAKELFRKIADAVPKVPVSYTHLPTAWTAGNGCCTSTARARPWTGSSTA